MLRIKIFFGVKRDRFIRPGSMDSGRSSQGIAGMKNLTLSSRFVGTQSTTLSEEELAWKCNKANLINMKINNFSSILYEHILNLLRLFLGGEVYQFIRTFSGEYKKYYVMELWGGGLNRTHRGFDLSKCVVKFSFLEMIIHHYEPLGIVLNIFTKFNCLVCSRCDGGLIRGQWCHEAPQPAATPTAPLFLPAMLLGSPLLFFSVCNSGLCNSETVKKLFEKAIINNYINNKINMFIALLSRNNCSF